ncbi:adenylate/guanylate cyclase domain-containing protein [Phaeobacter sp.]|uniref:adenylate/guanylate cyclase domain-containing protein n=1 Tax=Phaeobacter sp. TaxID=1902409 RepID=UPI0025E88E50|nr:adenylate/guanylate cyclase domain-containing protein [Phaeobacter sp.]
MGNFTSPLLGIFETAFTQQTLATWNAERRTAGEEEIRVGIGIHFGEVVLGNIGANRLEYTVIGNAVNVAARLEKLTRTMNAQILASDALFQAAADHPDAASLSADFVAHEDCVLRGLNDPMTLWALTRSDADTQSIQDEANQGEAKQGQPQAEPSDPSQARA